MSQSPAKKVYDVEIAGLSLKLKSPHDAETVKALTSLVNQKINQALPLTKSGSLTTAAVLACLNIAEEIMLLKRNAKDELETLEQKTQKMITSLESSRPPRSGIDH